MHKRLLSAAPAVLGLCLALGALFTADVLLTWDAAEGFSRFGPAALRWGVWLAAGAAAFAASRRAAACPAGLLAPCAPLGVCMVLTGALLLVCAGMAVLQGAALLALLPALAGFWLMIFASAAVAGPQNRPLGSAVWALLVLAWYFYMLIRRALVVPAAAVRLSCTLRVLSAAAALLLVLLLAKVLLVPGQPCGHTLFAAGVLSFLFCTCMELPLTLIETAAGAADPGQLVTALCFGATGLCGAVCAVQCLGPDTVP